MQKCTERTFIKSNDVPPGKLVLLCQRLSGADEPWKRLACEIKRRNGRGLRFSNDDVFHFSTHRVPAEALLNAWATDRPTLGMLYDALQSVGLEDAAEIVRVDILGGSPCVTDTFSPTEIVIEGQGHPQSSGLQRVFSSSKQSGQNISEVALLISDYCGNVEPDHHLTATGKVFSYSTLASWTSDFDDRPLRSGGRLLGQGSFGRVFLGRPPGKPPVAVKRFVVRDYAKVKLQFDAEIWALSSYVHENLVSLLGYSEEGDMLCLVYAFIPGGSLEQHLACKYGQVPLTAQQRVVIAQGTARGIHHLHTYGKRALLHRDIKTANILLDEKLQAVVGDFGLARLGPDASRTSTQTDNVIGTTVYMPIEYTRGGDLSIRTDAYSYGVVLLELLSGLPAFDTSLEDNNIISHVESMKSPIQEAIDTKAGPWDECVKLSMLNLALSPGAKHFLSNNKYKRLTITEALPEINSWTS